MTSRSPDQTRRIAVVAFPDVQVLDVVGPLEVFAIASRLLELRGRVTAAYAVEIVATRAGALTTSSGIGLLAARPLDRVRGGLDTLLVAGGQGTQAAMEDGVLVASLRLPGQRPASVVRNS